MKGRQISRNNKFSFKKGTPSQLVLSDFRVSISDKKILKGVDLDIARGSVHAIMGPNGSGKSTLAMSVMGHPSYLVEPGSKICLNGIDVSNLAPEEKAREGLFVSFQSPIEITGVSFLAFVRTAYRQLYPESQLKLSEFKKLTLKALKEVGLHESFTQRSLNEGFSGGERKRAEIAQLILLKPKVAILDEIDSGLDVDSLKIVSRSVSKLVKKGMTVLVITHYQRILHYLRPDHVHILVDGRIKRSGKISLVRKIEKNGYNSI